MVRDSSRKVSGKNTRKCFIYFSTLKHKTRTRSRDRSHERRRRRDDASRRATVERDASVDDDDVDERSSTTRERATTEDDVGEKEAKRREQMASARERTGAPLIGRTTMDDERGESTSEERSSDESEFDDGDHVDASEDGEPRERASPREVLRRATEATRNASEREDDCQGRATASRAEAFGKLEHELRRIVQGLKTSPQEDARRQGLMNRFNSLIATRFEGVRVAPFGSYVSAFHSAGSDIDISLQIEKDGPWYDEREEAQAKRSQRGGIRARRQQRQGKSKRAQLLRKVASELRSRNYRDVQLISNARVPLIKFKDPQTGVACDVCIENDGVYKSAVLGVIADLDGRYRDLVFLIKLWAKHYDVNSAMEGSFNSYSLCLLVMHHLQRRKVPILPPTMFLTIPRVDLIASEMDELAEHVACTDDQFDTWRVSKARMISDASRDIAAVKYRAEKYIGYGRDNKENLAELFVSFFSELSAVKDLFRNGLNVSTYHGTFIVHSSWQPFKYPLGVEDPFAAGDNVARAVQSRTRDYVLNAFPAACAEISAMLDAKDNIQFMKSMLSLLGDKSVPHEVLARLRPQIPTAPPGLRPTPPGMPPPMHGMTMMDMVAKEMLLTKQVPVEPVGDMLAVLARRQAQLDAQRSIPLQAQALNEQQLLMLQQRQQQEMLRMQQAQRAAALVQAQQDQRRTPIAVAALFQNAQPPPQQQRPLPHLSPPRSGIAPPGFGGPPPVLQPPREPPPSFGGLGGGVFSSIASGGGGLFSSPTSPAPSSGAVDEITQHFATNMSIMSEFTDSPPRGPAIVNAPSRSRSAFPFPDSRPADVDADARRTTRSGAEIPKPRVARP